MLRYPLKHEHTSLVCGHEITICLYKGLPQVMSSFAKDSRQTILPRVVKDSNRWFPLTLLRFPTDGPLRTLRFMGATNNPSPHNRARHFPKVLLIIRQAIPYRTHGGTFCPGVLTPKNQSLADSSKNRPQTMKVVTFPTIS
jgi:hypothetical protein